MTIAVTQISYCRHYNKFLIRAMTLPPHQSDKSLANQFASLLHSKKSRGSEICFQHLPQLLHHPLIYPLTCLTSVRSQRIRYLKIIKNSPTKSCLLDPVRTFLLQDCVDILLTSISKLANLSLIRGVFP